MPFRWDFTSWWPLNHRERLSSTPSTQPIIVTHRYVVALFAFLISVDLIEIVGILCYQLFTADYFPWHLYPMMLNRAVELVALICSKGYLPSMYSSIQVLLSLLSLTVYVRKQPCSEYNCVAPLILYSILLSYQIFVAVMMLKISRMPMADDDGHIIANWPRDHQAPPNIIHPEDNSPLGSLIIGISPAMMRARVASRVTDEERTQLDSNNARRTPERSIHSNDIFVAVQQPGHENFAIGKVCGGPNIIPKNDHQYSFYDDQSDPKSSSGLETQVLQYSSEEMQANNEINAPTSSQIITDINHSAASQSAIDENHESPTVLHTDHPVQGFSEWTATEISEAQASNVVVINESSDKSPSAVNTVDHHDNGDDISRQVVHLAENKSGGKDQSPSSCTAVIIPADRPQETVRMGIHDDGVDNGDIESLSAGIVPGQQLGSESTARELNEVTIEIPS